MSVLRAVLAATLAALLVATAPKPSDGFDRAIAAAKTAMVVNPATARDAAERAGRIAEQFSPSRDRELRLATAEWLQGEAASRQNDTATAVPLIDRALARLVNKTRSFKLRGDLLMSRGTLHATAAEVASALADYQAAYALFGRLKETRSQSLALMSIAILYKDADDNDNALKYNARARETYSGDPRLSLMIMINQGICLKDLKRYVEAEQQFGQALTLARALAVRPLEAMIFRNLARLAVDQGNYAAADKAISRGMVAARAANDLSVSQPRFDAIAAEIAARRNQLVNARALIESALAGVDLEKTDLSYREAHYTAYLVYTKLGDQSRALIHLQAMRRLDEQVWKLTASSNTALMAARFDSANQEARISKLKAEEAARKLAMERAQIEFQRILFGAIAAAALVVLALLGFGLFQSRRARVRLTASNAALEKALAAKTEFLATTSHEIRTPLNGILGMTQVMLADPRLDAASRDRVGIVHGAGLTMRGLVDDILDVAKMETGNLTIEAVPFDLRNMLEDVTRMWAEQARAKGLEFRLELNGCPRGMVGDAGRVRQIVYNLLSNAVKFTTTGSVSVRVACAGDRLRIAVTDTGIGIAADKHAEIFESFKQADGGTTRQFGGTGLGLAIVRNIAQAMQGAVDVASTPGVGATFTVALPYVAAVLAEPEPVAVAGGLLIVDKNPIARAMLKAVLAPRAGVVVFAGSTAEAIALVAERPVERIVLDEAAARADGTDPVAAVAQLVAAATAPVAVLWPTPDPATRAALLAAGVAQVIAKPIAGPALAALLYVDQPQEALVTQAA